MIYSSEMFVGRPLASDMGRNDKPVKNKDKQGIKSFTNKQARLYQWRNRSLSDRIRLKL